MKDTTKIALGAGGILAAAILIPKFFKKKEVPVPFPDQPPPPIPSIFLEVNTDPATGVTANSVQLNGNLISLGSQKEVDLSFEYGAVNGGGKRYSVPVGKVKVIGKFNIILKGLQPKTYYNYIATAKGISESQSGLLTYFTTEDVSKLTFGLLAGSYVTQFGYACPVLKCKVSNNTEVPIVNRNILYHAEYASPFTKETVKVEFPMTNVSLQPNTSTSIDMAPNVTLSKGVANYVWLVDEATGVITNQITYNI